VSTQYDALDRVTSTSTDSEHGALLTTHSYDSGDPSLLNGLGVAIDGLAMAVPFVPGGVGVIRSVGRGVEAMKVAGKGGKAVERQISSGLLKGLKAHIQR
jgi:hypothetical protein